MRRFLWIWLTLLGTYWAIRTAVTALMLQRADLGFATLLSLAVVPALQATAVWWVTREPGAPRVRDVVRAVATPWLWLFLAWDVAILAIGWLLPEIPFLTSAGAYTLGGAHHALLGLAAGLVVALSALRGPWPARDRIWLALFALWLPAAGASLLVPWWAGLPARLLPRLGTQLGSVAVLGTLLVLSVGLVLRVAAVWRPSAPAAAWLLELAVALALTSAALLILGLSHAADALDAWALLARACVYFAMTNLFLGAYRAFPRRR